jgi:hypothetical protein
MTFDSPRRRVREPFQTPTVALPFTHDIIRIQADTVRKETYA